MKIRITALFIATVIVFGQSPAPAASDSAKPVYQVKVVEVPAKAINYRNLKGSVEINFKSTELVSNANGVAEVTNKGGKTEIKAEFKGLMDAGHFGSEYLTYVFWGVSPDGRASNLGELIVKGGKSRLNAETPLQSLSLLVTAEPYFAVTQPSDAVVVENAIQPGNKAKIEWVDAKYGGERSIRRTCRRRGLQERVKKRKNSFQRVSSPERRANRQDRRGGNLRGGRV